ncbi:hypothetical protein N9605_07595 [Flavobacteriaceae bacterium]|nr:hypothetical protein [Flavobacteriaceae bacterium]
MKELLPRITTLVEPFTPEALLLIFTPAIFPLRACKGFEDFTLLISSPSTWLTEYPSDLVFFSNPKEETTTSSSSFPGSS